MNSLAFIDQISGWWNELTLAKQLFYGIGMMAALVSLVLALLALVGAEGGHDFDGPDAGDVDHSGGIFSVKPLTGFFLGFGWAGGIAMDRGLPLFVALLIAVAAGGALMAAVVVMVRMILSVRSDGTMQIEQALGAVGTVYVTVPPAKASGGQVIVNFSGRQETLGALTAAPQPIASGDKIKVTAIVDRHTVLVEAL
ncbi:MAG TPA: hypothetical protein VK477_08775 [Acidobacteriota bacterium]|nr:hypothetical protein [Acidobacteriota bacterium]